MLGGEVFQLDNAGWTLRFARWGGRWVLGFLEVVRDIGAFSLISVSVTLNKWRVSPRVMRPLIWEQVHRFGVCLLPMILFLGAALGILIIGQMVSNLTRVGAQSYIGSVMVTVVVRELGPLLAAMLLLARAGTSIVVELGTSRALGEVEALEALAIDPIHYWVVPRMLGLAVSMIGLTVYLILTAMVCGFLFAFLQDVPMTPGSYFGQIAAALRWHDFVLLGLKTGLFGAVIAVVACYEGLAQPLRLEAVPQATTRAVVRSLGACVALDAVFIIFYLI